MAKTKNAAGWQFLFHPTGAEVSQRGLKTTRTLEGVTRGQRSQLWSVNATLSQNEQNCHVLMLPAISSQEDGNVSSQRRFCQSPPLVHLFGHWPASNRSDPVTVATLSP